MASHATHPSGVRHPLHLGVAPSVISDNFSAAHDLTELILDRCVSELGWAGPLRFVGGRLDDHNTAARLEGFLRAQEKRSISVPDSYIMATGYSAEKAANALASFRPDGPAGLFVNSTISLEGVVQWHSELTGDRNQVRYGCFDWDPFGSFLPGNVGMVEQDVNSMLIKAFEIIGNPNASVEPILVPCKLRTFSPGQQPFGSN